jgi:hypothetical protein
MQILLMFNYIVWIFWVFGRVRIFAKSDSFVMSVCLSLRTSSWNISAPTGRLLMKFDILSIFGKPVIKISVELSVKITVGLHEELITYKISLSSS